MKTLVDFKRKLVEGAELTMIYHQKFNGRDENGTVIFIDDEPVSRVVKEVMSNQVCFLTDKGEKSYLQYPKASECIINDNSITILVEDYRRDLPTSGKLIPILTYMFK